MPQPFVEGSRVNILYLGTTEAGVVEIVEDEGRALVVVTEHDEVLRFHLMASMHYITPDHSARLAHA
jgi:hypothetical protein